MVSATFPYHTLTVKNTNPANINRMLAALPRDVAELLKSALENEEIHLGMNKLELGTAHSFNWRCILSHMGLTVEVAHVHGDLSVDGVKRLEETILSPRALSDSNLVAVPYSTEKPIRETMLRSIADREDWSQGLQ